MSPGKRRLAILVWHVFSIWYCIGFEHDAEIEFEERDVSEDDACNLLQLDARLRRTGEEQRAELNGTDKTMHSSKLAMAKRSSEGVQSHNRAHKDQVADGQDSSTGILRLIMDAGNINRSALANSLSGIIGTMASVSASHFQSEAIARESSSSSVILLLVAMLALPLVLVMGFGCFLYYPEQDDKLSSSQRRRPGTIASPVSSFANTTVPAGGQVVGIPRLFMPVAQEANVQVMDYLNRRVLYQALVSEKGFEPGIWLTAVDGVPVAFLDTKHAIMDATDEAGTVRNATGRRVVLHRINQHGITKTSGGGVTADIGEPYAVFVLNTHTGGGALIAQRVGLSSSSKFLLAVYLDAQGKITSVKDRSGNLLASTDSRENGELLDKWQRQDPGSLVLSLVPRGDSDTVLILSAVMAVLKMHPYFAF